MELETKTGKKEVGTARKLLEWMKKQELDIWWGEGPTNGSFYGIKNTNTLKKKRETGPSASGQLD